MGKGAIVSVRANPDCPGSETCNIILHDGRIIDFPIQLLAHHSQRNGCEHRILVLDERVSDGDLAQLRAAAAIRKAQEAAKTQAKKESWEQTRAKLLAEYPYLLVGDDIDTAAKNIRALLKRAFPGVKFSVRRERYSTINIRWSGGPDLKEVWAITDRFRLGYFDGMTDCYYLDENNVWATTFGGAEYVFCQREPL
ncbi:MAG: hypothetical protein DIU65_15495 [Proteobacteria bacterium]|nr:MAG: hypothetical protein DIU65_15495 [Pseudomonadota bacterium]